MSGYYLSVVNCAIEQLENEHDQLQRLPLWFLIFAYFMLDLLLRLQSIRTIT
jgi:hypothetical protein